MIAGMFCKSHVKCMLSVFKMKYLCTCDLETFQDSGLASSQKCVKQDGLLSSIMSLITEEDQ